MGIDIRFIQQLPSSFIDQDSENGQPGLFRFIRTADSNHDGDLTSEEIRAALPHEQNQNSYELDQMAQNAGRDIAQSCDFIRSALQNGNINLQNHSLAFRIFEPRITHSYAPQYQTTWNNANIDRNQNGLIERGEILAHLGNSINPRLEILEARLRQTAAGLHQMESHPEHRGLMNLFNIAGYLPMHLIGGLGNLFGSTHHATSIHEQIRIYAGMRNENRQNAIVHFMDYLRTHPQQSIQETLGQMNGTEQEILIQDLQVQNWQHVLTASTREESIDAHLQMAEYLIQGNYSTHTLSGGVYLDELLITPWKAENYAMANDIVTLLEREQNLSPEQRIHLQDLRRRMHSINLGGVLELPRANSLNELWDFTASTAIEIFLLRGGLKLFKAARVMAGAAIAARLAPAVNSLNYLFGCITGYLGISFTSATTAAATATATNPGTGAAVAGFLRQGLNLFGRGFSKSINFIFAASEVGVATNAINPAQRHELETDFTQRISAPDFQNEWVNANLASLALAIYREEHP